MTTAPNIDPQTLLRLGATVRSFAAGEKVFLENQTGDALYVVRSGRIDILTYGTVLENVRAGGIFGEMALVDDAPRSAAAMATEPSEVIEVNKASFLALIREHPAFALHVMHIMATRIRRMNQQFE